MEILKLKSRARTGKGKSYARKTRRQGWIPAVYYQHNKDTMNIEVDAYEFTSIVRAKKTTHLINLDLPDNNEEITTVIKEIQRHVLKDNVFFHIDFQHVDMNEKITVNCPIQLTGTAIGITQDSGVLSHPIRLIQIECLPANIPEHISVDISGLHVGESIHVKDISVPNIVIKDSPNEVIATIIHQQASVTESKPADEQAASDETDSSAEADKTETKEK